MSTLHKHLVRVTKMKREKNKTSKLARKKEVTRDSADIQSTRD